MKFITNLVYILAFGSIGVAAMLLSTCATDIQTSPEPGVLKVILYSDPADTQIVILSKTFTVSENDYFGATVFQGKVFSGEKFAFLYKDKMSYRQEDVTYNIIERKNRQYTLFTIFDSYVPPGNYDILQFGLNSNQVKIGYLEIPVKLPSGQTPMRKLERAFEIFENQTTEIKVQISPFQSVKRYRDAYQFIPEMKIIDIVHYK